MTALDGWDNFYVIVGSSAGALIGLQFVVVALLADMPRAPDQGQAGKAFATPNIVHFGTVLLLSAALTAPWQRMGGAAAVCGSVGLVGMIYSTLTTWRMRKQNVYRPVFEDWLFYGLIPLSAYVGLAASSWALCFYTHEALFGIAAVALMLLFCGIHNAWDAASYHVFVSRPKSKS